MFFTIAIALLIFEIITGSFYLLVISAAFATAGLANWLFNLSNSTGFIIVAIVSLLGVLIVKKHHHRIKQARANIKDDLADLDSGQYVTVTTKQADGYWQVLYRGTIWQAQTNKDITFSENETAIIINKSGNILNIRPLEQD